MPEIKERLHHHVRKVAKPVHKVYTKCPGIEHIGFVALATTEVFHLGSMVLIVNVILMIAGGAAVMYENFHLFRESEE